MDYICLIEVLKLFSHIFNRAMSEREFTWKEEYYS